jgi:hypothetical protein
MGRNSKKKKKQRRKKAVAGVRKATPRHVSGPLPTMYTGWFGFGDPPGEDGLFDDCPICQKMRELGYSGPAAPITNPDHLEQIHAAAAGLPQLDLDELSDADLEVFAAAFCSRGELN